jgi:CheY-like chemotaxis protein
MPALRLLVVEDDVASLELMEEVFASLRANVYGVSESGKAAELVNRERFDGIFLDLEMPTMSGFDLARWIRNSTWNRSTPIIIVTGRDDRQTMKDVFASGATFYLQKPVDRQKLNNLYRTVRGSMFESRRRFVRLALHTDVMCWVEHRQLSGVAWNLSHGGMQIDVGQLKPGDSVRLAFRLPTCAALVETTGRVVWVTEKRQGIRFDQLTPKVDQAIRDFIAEVEAHDSLDR